MKSLFLLLAAVLLLSPQANAQNFTTSDDKEWCEESNEYRNGNREKHCEVWETTLAANRDVIRVDGGQNGGIKVEGWNKNEILVKVKIKSWARSKDDAIDLVRGVEIETGRVIESDVPNSGRKESISVSYHIFVPHNSDLNLETYNGGIMISEVSGDIKFDALNGGVKLVGLGGDVRGETKNGGLRVELDGSEWEGEKLDVRTTNGGVLFLVPEDYNAQLETATVNGSLDLDFPVTVSGRINRNISVTIGNGGNTVKATTTNGGVKIKHTS